MSSHRARRDRVEPPSEPHVPPKPAERDEPELGRANSSQTVAVTLGVGIGLIVFLLALPYLGWL
ncbi:hypothetical protein [Nesterenkonia halotolerans]|uniref:Uncharacterized protein n=1 Tax=Nesterenkonia halotolerans TaxID=225325 RepID=A0ABR9J7X4_9MICC|nr:hypothetical protein [Nesterenkonia halotolerans]MBE1515005.1 hypothetical protein [Nesterenkonia halotolerans]